MPALDRRDRSRYATFTRRALLLSGGMTAVFATIAGRLYHLQIVEGEKYMTRAEENRVNQRLLAPLRGRIFDRFGAELATNRLNYRVLVVPEQTPGGVANALDALARVIGINERQRQRVLKTAAQNRNFVPVMVAENLSWDEFAKLNLHLPYLPGVQPDIGETRDYPYGAELSHVIGYVAAVSPEDKTEPDPLLDLPGFRIGKRGIEKAFDREIRGRAGTSRVEVNAYGRVIRELSREPGVQGEDVYLTVDRDVQSFTHQRLAAESAACVVMDVMQGDVLALVSTPGFDPNAFNVGITPEDWKALTENDHNPLMNKALSGVYPPGSTFKIAVALAALEAGIAKPDFSVFCTGKTSLGNHDFHCWKKEGHGHVDFRLGIKYSCDIYFYEIAKRLGIDRIEEASRKLGLGEVTGIEIPGERAGLIPSRGWKLARFGVPWQQGETLIAGIGQGYLLTTPLQLCTMTARVAGGLAVRPRIVRSLGRGARDRAEAPPLAFGEAALRAVRDGLNAVTNEVRGTAYAARIAEAGMEMAGKTGTAQVRRISREERVQGVRTNEQVPWALRDHALFVGYAPVHAPRYACAVVIEHGGGGSKAAAPVARDVLKFTQERDPLGRPAASPLAQAPAAGRKG